MPTLTFETVMTCTKCGHIYVRFGLELWKNDMDLAYAWIPQHTCPICNTFLIRRSDHELDQWLEHEAHLLR